MHWREMQLGTVRSASETNLSSNFDVLPLNIKKTLLCNVKQLWKLVMPLKCCVTGATLAVQHTMKLFLRWFHITSLIGMFTLKEAITIKFYCHMTQNGCNIYARGT